MSIESKSTNSLSFQKIYGVNFESFYQYQYTSWKLGCLTCTDLGPIKRAKTHRVWNQSAPSAFLTEHEGPFHLEKLISISCFGYFFLIHLKLLSNKSNFEFAHIIFILFHLIKISTLNWIPLFVNGIEFVLIMKIHRKKMYWIHLVRIWFMLSL